MEQQETCANTGIERVPLEEACDRLRNRARRVREQASAAQAAGTAARTQARELLASMEDGASQRGRIP
jgi:hypothetical protein